MSPVLERLYELMRERGVNAKRVCEELNMSNSAFTDWKKGKAKPGVEALSKLAEYFDVTLDYLVLGKENESNAEPPVAERIEYKLPDYSDMIHMIDQDILIKFHRLSSENQGKVMAYIDGMLAALPVPAMQNQNIPAPRNSASPAAETESKPESEPTVMETETELKSEFESAPVNQNEEDGRMSA